MPVQAIAASTSESTAGDLKQFYLDKIYREIRNAPNVIDDLSGSDLSDVEDTAEAIRDGSLIEYRELVEKTRDLRLDKLIRTKEGCSIFDELCVRIDVNQKYASVLPQWKDLADVLEVDKLRTEWIETCVRPREGLTRAMLEVYMSDGGTVGDVLDALVRLELFEVVEMLKPKLVDYLHQSGRTELTDGNKDLFSDHFFSVLKTLADALGKSDPCHNLQKYAGGLKNVCRSEASEITTIGLVQSPPEVLLNAAIPKYKSDVHFKQISEAAKKPAVSGSCKILLLFSEDGVPFSDQAVEWARQVPEENGRVDFFRLNETSLWYEMLTNAEGCCLKWTSEADYIIPILTPKFLQEIHCSSDGNSAEFLPTSPIINRYMYTLMRAQYTAAGCKNLKVRPLIPEKFVSQVSRSNAIVMDPMFNHVWIPMTQKKLEGRITALLKEHSKRQIT